MVIQGIQWYPNGIQKVSKDTTSHTTTPQCREGKVRLDRTLGEYQLDSPTKNIETWIAIGRLAA